MEIGDNDRDQLWKNESIKDIERKLNERCRKTAFDF